MDLAGNRQVVWTHDQNQIEKKSHAFFPLLWQPNDKNCLVVEPAKK